MKELDWERSSEGGTMQEMPLPQHVPTSHFCCRLVTLGIPLSTVSLLSYTANIISLAYVGRLSAHNLAAAVLGNRCVHACTLLACLLLMHPFAVLLGLTSMSVHASSLFNVTGFSVLMGLSSAMETLCGQVSTGMSCSRQETLVLTLVTHLQNFGAGKYAALGVILQRSLLISGVVFAIIMVLWTQIDKLLVLLGERRPNDTVLARWTVSVLMCSLPTQKPASPEEMMSLISARRSTDIVLGASGQDVAMSILAARYMRVMIPGLACAAVNESLKRYLMAQNVVLPETLAMLFATALSPLFNHILVIRAGAVKPVMIKLSDACLLRPPLHMPVAVLLKHWRNGAGFGLDGAAWAANAVQLTSTFGISGYMIWREKELHGTDMQTWHGW